MNGDDSFFSKYDFHAYISRAPERIAQAVEKLNDSDLFRDESELTDQLVQGHLVHVPSLKLDAQTADQREVTFDIGHDPQWAGQVKGTEICLRIPFTGDADLFQCRPSTFTLNPPRGRVEQKAVVIRVAKTDHNVADFKKELDNTIAAIQRNLDQLRRDCAGLEQELRSAASTEIAKRRKKRRKDQNLLNELGFGEQTTEQNEQ